MIFLPNLNISRKELGLLLILFITEFSRGAFFLNFLPLYAVNHLGLSVAAAGFAVSAHYLTETLFKTVAGWQLDRLGRPVLLGGLFLSLAALLLIKNYPTPVVLVGASALFGLGVSPVWLGVISEVAPVRAQDRAARIGLVFTTWLAGAGSGLVCINFLMSRSFNLAFWFIIFLWAFALAAACFLVPAKHRTVESEPDTEGGILQTMKRMSENRALTRVLIPGMFLQTLAAGLLVPVLPLFAQNKLGLDYDQYALLLMAGGATALVFMLPMGRLADRFTLKFLLSTGFGLSGLALGLIAYTTGILEVFLWTGLLGFSYAIVLPAWNSLLAKTIPADKQATGWGIFATIEGLGVAAGPALGGIVAKGMGIGATILATTIVLLAMALFYFLYPLEKLFSK